ncbi:MAG: TrkH family potassium uptake protein [Lachnospiraceae bacterium]|nr:TrkH family potassium uptake protein [Lachnospiraceae bacterium]
MNYAMIAYIVGAVLRIEGVLLLGPCAAALYYSENVGWYYLGVAAFCELCGWLLVMLRPTDQVFYLKEGCVATALSWLALSFFGGLPMYISGQIPHFVDAMFESVSGFTTTGATVCQSVEALAKSTLLWRSMTHWIGGMGILVFLLAIVPLSGGSNMNIMRAESPGPSVGKLVPKVRHTARILYVIYMGLTLLEIILLVAGGMSLFDSVNHSMATAGTGGFGVRNDSIASYTPYLQWVVTVFMIAFGVNFNFYYFILFRQFRKAFGLEEVRNFLLIILAAILCVFLSIRSIYGVSDGLRHAAFQVGSIISTTGFTTANFDAWPQVARTILVLLMFIGSCAGSTGGGLKVSRVTIAVKTVRKELTAYLHPKSIKKIRFEGKPVEHDVVRSINVYFITFLILFTGSVLLVSVNGYDLETNLTAVAATINNVGPGLAKVGPTVNFGHFSILSKCVLIFDMIAGRLELFPLLMLFHPGIWKEVCRRRK